jgi:hypothetical protein
MWITVLFVYALAALLVALLLRLFADGLRSSRLKMITGLIAGSALVSLLIVLFTISFGEPRFWFLLAFCVALLAFVVWALRTNAAEKRAGHTGVDLPPPRRGRRWDRNEQPPDA